MKIYLAARYSRNPEMRGVRDVLEALGHEVTSRWIDHHDGALLESVATAALNSDPASVRHYGQHDLEDLIASDIVISFTSTDGGGKGGRHVEFGYALALNKRVIVVGPRENVFHTLSDVEHYQDWSALARMFSGEWLEQQGIGA